MENIKLFDSHAHYNDRRFDEEFEGGAEGAITAAFDAGVCGFINVGTEPENSKKSIEIASLHDNVYAAVGLHPEDAANYEYSSINSILDEIKKLAEHEKVIALGEIGLDYHWDTPHDLQKEVFDAQLSMAKELKLPVIIHNRDAHGDTFDMLKAHPDVIGVMHSYSGSAEMVREYTRRGWYISFAGPVSYKTAEKVRDACRSVPSDRILIETDCPYLPPVPYRGKINYSGYMKHTLEAMAAARSEDIYELAERTLRNTESLFNIKI